MFPPRFFAVVVLLLVVVSTTTTVIAAAAAATAVATPPEMMMMMHVVAASTPGGALVAAEEQEEEPRGLKQQQGKGNPEKANEFLSKFAEALASDTSDTEEAPPPPSSSSTTTLTDFQLACGNTAADGEQAELNLFGSQNGLEATSCLCDYVNSLVICSYGDPVVGDSSSSFLVQQYYAWSFDRWTGQFQMVFACQFLCTDDGTGTGTSDCFGGDTTVFDSNCQAVGGFVGLPQPAWCAVFFESSAFAICQDCQVCAATTGHYGVAPTYTGCFTLSDGNTCLSYPVFYNPFPALRATAVNRSLNAGESGATTVGGVIGGLLVILVVGLIYYYLHQGKCPRLPCCQKKKEETQYGIKEAKTMSSSEADERNDPTTQTDRPDP